MSEGDLGLLLLEGLQNMGSRCLMFFLITAAEAAIWTEFLRKMVAFMTTLHILITYFKANWSENNFASQDEELCDT